MWIWVITDLKLFLRRHVTYCIPYLNAIAKKVSKYSRLSTEKFRVCPSTTRSFKVHGPWIMVLSRPSPRVSVGCDWEIKITILGRPRITKWSKLPVDYWLIFPNLTKKLSIWTSKWKMIWNRNENISSSQNFTKEIRLQKLFRSIFPHSGKSWKNLAHRPKFHFVKKSWKN